MLSGIQVFKTPDNFARYYFSKYKIASNSNFPDLCGYFPSYECKLTNTCNKQSPTVIYDALLQLLFPLKLYFPAALLISCIT